jgi:hypothetical protein
MIIQRREITNTLPNGILEDGEFTPDDSSLAVHMRGFYTIDELKAILQDLTFVDSQYRLNKSIRQAVGAAIVGAAAAKQ